MPIVLELSSSQYTRWRELFLLAFGKFALEDHVLRDDPNPAFLNWECMDGVVKSWPYGAIFPELSAMVPCSCPTARSLWLAVESQFLGT